MNTPLPHPNLPLLFDLTLLEQASKMRQTIDALLGQHLTPRERLIAHYRDLEALAAHGAILAVDLTVDIAYILEDDPRNVPGLVTLDPETLAARTRDMIAMRSRRLN
ncbi:MAG: hypothetical protein H6636_06850 [Anaerolineales bacterium]|nr:hypothetical protein [Anaerolineales bacterium]